MSLPPELRLLCFQLSATPTTDLPRIVPNLQRYVLRCQKPLSTLPLSTPKADASAASVLVHKLKTQLSSLINGRNPEGRFAAAVLIKSVIEVGGWEVLRGAESWVRGLLSTLAKPDPDVTKELCIITLTKIYSMTHQYPTLIREITTPTLPGFVTSCLTLISSSKLPSLTETIFRSFSTLLPHHTTIYRPFATQIRNVTRPYLAPTVSESLLVPLSLQESARRLAVLVHQTAAKNGGGEEWGKAFRAIVKATHNTADHVFRAIIEDWESVAGYVPAQIDVNMALGGGGQTEDDFPGWTGIVSGTDRLTGLIQTMNSYLLYEASVSVCVPLGGVMDVITRMLSIAAPSESSASLGGVRLHPGVDRDERDGLWSGMPQIHVATLALVNTLAERMPESLVTIAPILLEQLAWLFPLGSTTPEFRTAFYPAVADLLSRAGRSFNKLQVGKLGNVIRACCKDILPQETERNSFTPGETLGKKPYVNGSSNQNADTFSQQNGGLVVEFGQSDLRVSATQLLPLFLSHLLQQHLDISMRSLIERTAILSGHKDAMVASILNPFVGRNGKALASILPHLTRQYGNDAEVEMLLRPRMPMIPSVGRQHLDLDADIQVDAVSYYDSEDIIVDEKNDFSLEGQHEQERPASHPSTSGVDFAPQVQAPSYRNTMAASDVFTTAVPTISIPQIAVADSSFARVISEPSMEAKGQEDIAMDLRGPESSDDESVHLTMELDTDSESE
ncbi:ARM repeat-containing protein [Glarea lozoyensis ATCC 20868]|uniref:Pre-rRNA-processing protein RIX1 n=1 Tax=Glarea lozoyensis (strain ATCC 20868 / MF5171) TaxID=1116229 RepID=S3DV01_GLAL2|nr:ARM repeat-containing protein [Glarea lozoyensis ATCC 20868]EPE30228.1 ARM repeat-containing protein [Glarea lozoyensis ATCC 20868]